MNFKIFEENTLIVLLINKLHFIQQQEEKFFVLFYDSQTKLQPKSKGKEERTKKNRRKENKIKHFYF